MLEHKTMQYSLASLGDGCRGWGLRKGLGWLWTVHWDGKKVGFLEVVPEGVEHPTHIASVCMVEVQPQPAWQRCSPNLQSSAQIFFRSEI